MSALPAIGGTVIELVARRRLAAARRPVPPAQPGQAALRVLTVGVCGTDLHRFRGRDDRYPTVLGHDLAARVEKVGEGVDATLVGTRVTVDPNVSCGRCPHCSSGHRNRCATGGYLGMTATGVLGEIFVVDADCLVRLADEVSDVAASVLEPVAVALHLQRRVDPLLKPPAQAHIIGGGPIGLAAALVLDDAGWSARIHEPREERRSIAAEFGIAAVAPDEGVVDPAEPPRLVVDASASAGGVDLSERLAAPGSVIAVVGRGPRSPAPPAVLLNELSVLGIKGGAGRYAEAVELVRRGVVATERLVSHRYPFMDAQTAFDDAIRHDSTVMRAVLEGPWSGT